MLRRGKVVKLTWTADPALHAPPRYRRACNYEAFVPDPVAGWRLALEGDLAMVVLDAESRVQALNAASIPALGPLARLLLRTESIASSKVEGMQADVRSVARAEARQGLGAMIGPEALEVLANIDAMQLAIEETARSEQLSVDQVCRIHEALLAHAPGHARHAGQIRVEQNWIGGNDYNPCGADFVPPTPEHVGPLLGDLVSFCAEESMPPVVQAAIAHAQFETIHPFVDGNGRTGRALVHVLLRRRGTTPHYVPPISVVLAAERERYVAGLEAFRDGDVSGWIEHFAVATARAADLAGTYLQRVSELQQTWRDQLARAVGPRADAAAWKVIDALPAHPIMSIPVAVVATSRTRPAVAQAFEQLVAAGVLTPLSESRRNRSFEAVGLLDLLEELEAGAAQGR